MKLKRVFPCLESGAAVEVPDKSKNKIEVPKTGSLILQFATALNGK